MAYTAWSVVYGEQPTAAKWNQLGTNDAGFKDGTNIDNGVITSAKLGDSGWINVTFQNGWTNGASPVSYRKIGDIVFLRGQPTKGTLDGTVIATLPVGYRAAVQRIWTCPGSSLNYGKIVVNADGSFAMAALPAGGSYLGLDAVNYPIG